MMWRPGEPRRAACNHHPYALKKSSEGGTEARLKLSNSRNKEGTMTQPRRLFLATIIAFTPFSGASQAALIDEGMTTLDTETGIEWLDVTETVGASPADIVVGGYGGFAADGWVHATVEQIETLYLHAGIPLPYNGSLTSAGYAGTDLVIDLLGASGSHANGDFIQAFSGTLSQPGGPPYRLHTPTVLTAYGTIGGAVLPGPGVPSYVRNETIGNYLVRSASGPGSVVIDIKPGSDPNSVNPRSNGVIPVAILGAENFDVSIIDPSSLRFGPMESHPAHRLGDPFVLTHHLKDVNLDGRPDLVAHFRTWLSGIECGDPDATLTGSTVDGQPFAAADTIRTVGCRVSSRETLSQKVDRVFEIDSERTVELQRRR
jgi:hypothetical protein